MMEAKEANHPSFNHLSSRSTNSEEQKDEEGGQEQDISAHDCRESDSEVSLCSTPVLSSFASYDMADMRFECEVDEIPDFDYLSPSSRWISRKDVFGSISSSWRSTSVVTGRREEEENQTKISHPLRLAQRIRNAADEAEVFQEECLVLAKLSDEVSDHLWSISQLVVSNRYLSNCRGLGQVQVNCTASLKLALELLLRCGSSKITRLRRNINKIDYKDFHKPTYHLESTVENVKWLFSIFSAIVSNKLPNIEPNVGNIISYWLQTQISVLNADDSKHSNRVTVANALRDLARENEKNKQLIVNEGAVPALLNVLKRPSFESQFAAISTLVTLASHYESIPTIVFMDYLPVIVDLLSNSSEAMQTEAASFIALLAGRSSLAEGFWELDTVPPFMRFLLKSNNNNCSISYAEIILGLSYLSEAHYLSNMQIMKNNGIPFLLKLIEKESGHLKNYCTEILRNIIDFVENSTLYMLDLHIGPQESLKELLMVVCNVEVDTKLRCDAIQIVKSLVDRVYPREARDEMATLVKQLNDENKNLVEEVLKELLNIIDMESPCKKLSFTASSHYNVDQQEWSTWRN